MAGRWGDPDVDTHARGSLVFRGQTGSGHTARNAPRQPAGGSAAIALTPLSTTLPCRKHTDEPLNNTKRQLIRFDFK